MNSLSLSTIAKDVYPSLLGSLHYAVVCTRPDVSTAFFILGSAQAHPTETHLRALKKVARCPHGTIDLRLTLGGGSDHNLQLTCFAYAGWATDNSTR
jgi:hypothetical protein